jgi:hypothetical protein
MSLLVAAAFAVSVTVVAPANAPQHHWVAAPAATLGGTIVEWAAIAGAPKPQIDGRIAEMTVGGVVLSSGNFCAAVQTLVAALKHTHPHPVLMTCDAHAPAQIVAAETDLETYPQ